MLPEGMKAALGMGAGSAYPVPGLHPLSPSPRPIEEGRPPGLRLWALPLTRPTLMESGGVPPFPSPPTPGPPPGQGHQGTQMQELVDHLRQGPPPWLLKEPAFPRAFGEERTR